MSATSGIFGRSSNLHELAYSPSASELVKIVDIREMVVPIKSAIRNAFIDFSQMTVSVLALITDVNRDGKPVVGYGFNSIGRYAQSVLLQDRFIPRLKAA